MDLRAEQRVKLGSISDILVRLHMLILNEEFNNF